MMMASPKKMKRKLKSRKKLGICISREIFTREMCLKRYLQNNLHGSAFQVF